MHTQHGSSPNLAIRHALLRHGDGAKQSFRTQRNLEPDTRQFLSGIVALLTSAIRTLHATHVNDQIRRLIKICLFSTGRTA